MQSGVSARPDRGDHGISDNLSRAGVWQVQEADEPGGTLDEGADLGGLVFANDQIALPVPRYGSIVGFSRALRDIDHARNATTAITATRPTAWFPQRTPGAQTCGQLTA